ncbi:hypothetical protein LCGC14_3102650, partial [marine sediment metagenome]
LAAGSVAMVAAARYTYEHEAVFTNTVNKMTIGQGEKSIYIPKFGSIVVNDLTDGVDMTNAQTLSITGTTHTTDEVGAKVIVTKKLRNQLKEPAFRAAGKVIGNSMGKKLDQDGLALFSGLDSGLGGAGTTFTLGHVLAAVTQCRGQAEPVPWPMIFVAHPYILHILIDKFSDPSTSNFPEQFMLDTLKDYWVGNVKLYNLPVLADGNISIDSEIDSYGAVYSKESFIYVVSYEPENWVVYDDSLRGWEIGIVHDYKMVEEDGGYGRYMLFDSPTPSS